MWCHRGGTFTPLQQIATTLRNNEVEIRTLVSDFYGHIALLGIWNTINSWNFLLNLLSRSREEGSEGTSYIPCKVKRRYGGASEPSANLSFPFLSFNCCRVKLST
jgi:hypothetical protein